MITKEKLDEMGNIALMEAESIFGKREKTNFKGFEFWDEPPQLRGDRIAGYTIYTSRSAEQIENTTIFQLSHEVIHLLSPTSKLNVSVFEEGWATSFSLNRIDILFGEPERNRFIDHLKIKNGEYFEAYSIVSGITDVYTQITSIREKFPNKIFSDLTPEDLKDFIPDLGLRNRLTAKFKAN
jgi:hypothetical protein